MIDLSDVKPACIIDGVPWYDFLFEYDWEGKTYGFDICARNAEEAQARLKRLPLARYLGPGERSAPIPDTRFNRGWLTVVCWWRNRKVRNAA